MSKSVNWLRERLIKINEADEKQKLEMTDELFETVLNEADLYIVLLKETTEEELENNRARAYIQTLDNLENKCYLRLFTDEIIAKEFARKAGCIKDDKELVIKISKEQFIMDVKDAFMMIGLDGILLEDGKYFVTISSEELLKIGILKILKLEKGYDINFINTVRCIFDIKMNRYRLVTPLIKYDGICKEDFIKGKAKLHSLSDELLIIEYYEKYKLENIFKDGVYYLDMNLDDFYSVIKKAVETGIEKVNMIYAGKKAVAFTKDILGLLEVIK